MTENECERRIEVRVAIIDSERGDVKCERVESVPSVIDTPSSKAGIVGEAFGYALRFIMDDLLGRPKLDDIIDSMVSAL